MNLSEIKEAVRLLTKEERYELIEGLRAHEETQEIDEFAKEFPSVQGCEFMHKYDVEFDGEITLNFAYEVKGVSEPDDYRWSDDQKEYVYLVTNSLGLYAASENTYFIESKEDEVRIVSRLKE